VVVQLVAVRNRIHCTHFDFRRRLQEFEKIELASGSGILGLQLDHGRNAAFVDTDEGRLGSILQDSDSRGAKRFTNSLGGERHVQ